jgi:hypothetical protein
MLLPWEFLHNLSQSSPDSFQKSLFCKGKDSGRIGEGFGKDLGRIWEGFGMDSDGF